MQLRQISIPLGDGYLKTEETANSIIDYAAGYALCFEVSIYDGETVENILLS